MNLKIFLSYSWADKDAVDIIENQCSFLNIPLSRDVHELKYKDSIQGYMDQIDRSDFVLMILSDEYLKSENCMYEVLKLLSTQAFYDKILPIKMPNAKIFRSEQRMTYYDHWQNEIALAEERSKKHLKQDMIKQLERVKKIYDGLDTFFSKIIDINIIPHEELWGEGYSQIINILIKKVTGYSNEINTILSIKDAEEKEIALEDFLKKYPDNHFALFELAKLADKGKRFKKAKRYYEQMIICFPEFYIAYLNLGIILQKELHEYAAAQRLYEKVIEIRPDLSSAHHHYGRLLAERLGNNEAAKEQYDLALKIDPSDGSLLNSYASLLMDKFGDYEGAEKFYKKAIENEPLDGSYHHNYGVLLSGYLSKKKESIYHYKKAIEYAPEVIQSYVVLGLILFEEESNIEEAKYYWEEALKLDDSLAHVHANLGFLYGSDQLSKFDLAKFHLERAIELNAALPTPHATLASVLWRKFGECSLARYHYNLSFKLGNDGAVNHMNFGTLLWEEFDDHDEALEQYKKAINKDPNLAEAHNSIAALYYNHFSNLIKFIEHYNIATTLDPQYIRSEIDDSLRLIGKSLR